MAFQALQNLHRLKFLALFLLGQGEICTKYLASTKDFTNLPHLDTWLHLKTISRNAWYSSVQGIRSRNLIMTSQSGRKVKMAL